MNKQAKIKYSVIGILLVSIFSLCFIIAGVIGAGDGICEITENVFGCPDDCGRFSMATLYSNCVDDDELTHCFFDSNISYLMLFSFGGVILGASFVRVRTPGKRKKVPIHSYIRLKMKKQRRRR